MEDFFQTLDVLQKGLSFWDNRLLRKLEEAQKEIWDDINKCNASINSSKVPSYDPSEPPKKFRRQKEPFQPQQKFRVYLQRSPNLEEFRRVLGSISNDPLATENISEIARSVLECVLNILGHLLSKAGCRYITEINPSADSQALGRHIAEGSTPLVSLLMKQVKERPLEATSSHVACLYFVAALTECYMSPLTSVKRVSIDTMLQFKELVFALLPNNVEIYDVKQLKKDTPSSLGDASNIIEAFGQAALYDAALLKVAHVCMFLTQERAAPSTKLLNCRPLVAKAMQALRSNSGLTKFSLNLLEEMVSGLSSVSLKDTKFMSDWLTDQSIADIARFSHLIIREQERDALRYIDCVLTETAAHRKGLLSLPHLFGRKEVAFNFIQKLDMDFKFSKVGVSLLKRIVESKAAIYVEWLERIFPSINLDLESPHQTYWMCHLIRSLEHPREVKSLKLGQMISNLFQHQDLTVSTKFQRALYEKLEGRVLEGATKGDYDFVLSRALKLHSYAEVDNVQIKRTALQKGRVKSYLKSSLASETSSPLELYKSLYLLKLMLEFGDGDQFSWVNWTRLQRAIHKVILEQCHKRLKDSLNFVAESDAAALDMEVNVGFEAQYEMNDSIPKAVVFYYVSVQQPICTVFTDEGASKFCTDLLELYSSIATTAKSHSVFKANVAAEDNFFGNLVKASPEDSLGEKGLAFVFELLATVVDSDDESLVSEAQLKRIAHLHSLLRLAELLESDGLLPALGPAVARGLNNIGFLTTQECKVTTAWILTKSRKVSLALKSEVIHAILSNIAREKLIFQLSAPNCRSSVYVSGILLHLQANLNTEIVPRRVVAMPFIYQRKDLLSEDDTERVKLSIALAKELMGVVVGSTDSLAADAWLPLLEDITLRHVFTKSWDSTPETEKILKHTMRKLKRLAKGNQVTTEEELDSDNENEVESERAEEMVPTLTPMESPEEGYDAIWEGLKVMKQMLRRSRFDVAELAQIVEQIPDDSSADVIFADYVSKVLVGIASNPSEEGLSLKTLRLLLEKLGSLSSFIKSVHQRNKLVDHLMIHYGIVEDPSANEMEEQTSALKFSADFLYQFLLPETTAVLQKDLRGRSLIYGLLMKALQCTWAQIRVTEPDERISSLKDEEVFQHYQTYPSLRATAPAKIDPEVEARQGFLNWIASSGLLSTAVLDLSCSEPDHRTEVQEMLALYSVMVEFELWRSELEYMAAVGLHQRRVAKLKEDFKDDAVKLEKKISRLPQPSRKYPFPFALNSHIWLCVVRRMMTKGLPRHSQEEGTILPATHATLSPLEPIAASVCADSLMPVLLEDKWKALVSAQLTRSDNVLSKRAFELSLWKFVAKRMTFLQEGKALRSLPEGTTKVIEALCQAPDFSPIGEVKARSYGALSELGYITVQRD